MWRYGTAHKVFLYGKGFGEKVQAFKRVPEIVLQTGEYLRVCPKTSGGITKFSEHEAD